jgi:hypothetical protein
MTMDQKLEALIAHWQARPFTWGVTDCCQLAKDAVWTLHTVIVDHPPYSTEREALRVLKSLGGYRGLLARTHRQVLAGAAQRGDIVIVRNVAPFGEALAVVTGTHAHTTGPSGLVAVPRAQWLECWRVL